MTAATRASHLGSMGAVQSLATIPEFLRELSLGIYAAVKGFRPSSPILRDRNPSNQQVAMYWRRCLVRRSGIECSLLDPEPRS